MCPFQALVGLNAKITKASLYRVFLCLIFSEMLFLNISFVPKSWNSQKKREGESHWFIMCSALWDQPFIEANLHLSDILGFINNTSVF